MASLSLISVLLNSGSLFTIDLTSLSVIGLDPNNKDIPKSIGLLLKWESSRFKWEFSVASPKIENGARSFSQIALNKETLSSLMARTYLS